MAKNQCVMNLIDGYEWERSEKNIENEWGVRNSEKEWEVLRRSENEPKKGANEKGRFLSNSWQILEQRIEI